MAEAPEAEQGPASEPVEEQTEAPQEKAPPAEEPKGEDPWWKDTKIWINLVGYVAVTLALVMIKVRPEFMPANERGFSCEDINLSYPTRPESVQIRTLIISTVSILLMSVFISEGVYSITPEYQTQRSLENLGDVPLKDKVYLFINLVTSKLLYGYLGLILTMNMTFHMQHMASGYRPDFLKTCLIKPAACSGPSNIAYFKHCQQPNKDLLTDGRMSFPSEYASISFYMTVFSSMIIERAISNDFFALKIAVQSSYIFWAIYVSTSRIKDNKNHPIDTFAGCLLGVIIAFLTDYLATYQDYQDMGMLNYDPSNITLNIQDWEEQEQMPMEEHPEQQGAQDYHYP